MLEKKPKQVVIDQRYKIILKLLVVVDDKLNPVGLNGKIICNNGGRVVEAPKLFSLIPKLPSHFS